MSDVESIRKNHDTDIFEFAQMEAELRAQNQAVQERVYCVHCDTAVRQEDYDWKYMQAGGVLEGPFCGKNCQFGWLLEDSDNG